MQFWEISKKETEIPELLKSYRKIKTIFTICFICVCVLCVCKRPQKQEIDKQEWVSFCHCYGKIQLQEGWAYLGEQFEETAHHGGEGMASGDSWLPHTHSLEAESQG